MASDLKTHEIVYKLAGKMNSRQLKLFACDCAEHVLPIFEKRYPGDDRPRKIIETIRQSANREPTDDEIEEVNRYATELKSEAIENSAEFIVYAAFGTASFNMHALHDVDKAASSGIFMSAHEKDVPEPWDEVMEFRKWQIQRAQAILDGLYDRE